MRANPESVLLAFDEAIRHTSPARVMHRVTIEGGCELSGVRLDGDVKVGCYIAAANRDPLKWENPELFDIHRKGLSKHLAFGAGATKCLGLVISRFEAEALLKALVKRVKTIELAGSERPSYRRINTLRTLESLPLRFTL